MGQAITTGFALGDEPVAPDRTGNSPEQVRAEIARGLRCPNCGNENHLGPCYEMDDPRIYRMFGFEIEED